MTNAYLVEFTDKEALFNDNIFTVWGEELVEAETHEDAFDYIRQMLIDAGEDPDEYEMRIRYVNHERLGTIYL